MFKHSRSLLISFFLCFIVACCPALADTSNPNLAPYLRYLPNEGKLDTSVLTLINNRGQQIDLISAVHVASPDYYKTLNRLFRSYDAVLYELVLPDNMVGQQLPSQMETGSGISGMQGRLALSLGLVTQIAAIDYSAPNFVHADLTQNGLTQKMAERQENLSSYMMKLLLSSQSIDQSQLGVTEDELAQVDMMSVFSGKTSTKDRRILRKLFASTLSSSGGLLSSLGDSALISDRNDAALSVTEREIQSGKRRLALFYGAAHMPDLQQRLMKKGWKPSESKWLTAWNI